MSDGTLGLEINNKIVFVTQNRDVYGVISISAKTSTQADVYKKEMLEYVNFGICDRFSIEGVCKDVQSYFGDGFVRFYYKNDYVNIGRREKEGWTFPKNPRGWDNYSYTRDYEKSREYRRKVKDKISGEISDSQNNETLYQDRVYNGSLTQERIDDLIADSGAGKRVDYPLFLSNPKDWYVIATRRM